MQKEKWAEIKKMAKDYANLLSKIKEKLIRRKLLSKSVKNATRMKKKAENVKR